MKSFDYYLIIFTLLFTSIGLTTTTTRIDEPNITNKLEILANVFSKISPRIYSNKII